MAHIKSSNNVISIILLTLILILPFNYVIKSPNLNKPRFPPL